MEGGGQDAETRERQQRQRRAPHSGDVMMVKLEREGSDSPCLGAPPLLQATPGGGGERKIHLWFQQRSGDKS